MTEPNKKPRPLKPLAERKNFVDKADFAKVLPPVDGFLPWFRSSSRS